jgi:hypothetical protein
MTAAGPLVYVFWHWARPSIGREEYEAHQRTFHETFAAHPPDGFVGSSSSMVSGAPWANAGSLAYEDRYVLRDAAALDTLDESVANPPHLEAHRNAAKGAAGGAAGLYRVRLGAPLAGPRHAAWFAKGEGVVYDDFLALMDPLVREGEAVLYMRRMVLGPTPEFCLQSVAPVTLPSSLRRVELLLHPVWLAPNRQNTTAGADFRRSTGLPGP